MTGPAHGLSEAAVAFVRDQRVGRLATIRSDGVPSLVPVCYALIDGDPPAIAIVLDEKPKSVPVAALARVRNIRRDPRVSLIVDRYDEDWSQLAFVQLRGHARILEPDEDGHATAITALRAKYRQHQSMAIERRPVILITMLRPNAWGFD